MPGLHLSEMSFFLYPTIFSLCAMPHRQHDLTLAKLAVLNKINPLVTACQPGSNSKKHTNIRVHMWAHQSSQHKYEPITPQNRQLYEAISLSRTLLYSFLRQGQHPNQ